MANNKKLFTLAVEDEFSSSAADIFESANEAAREYSSVYNWTDISIVKSGIRPSGKSIIHYFDILGKGDALSFDQKSDAQSHETPTRKIAAKDLSP